MAEIFFIVIVISIIIGVCGLLPIVVYFCVKFGTVAFYKAKQFIEHELDK